MFHKPSRHTELYIGFKHGIIIRVDLRGDALEARLENQEVEMGRPKIVALLSVQEVANRAIDRYWIPRRLDAPEAKTAIRVGGKFSAQVHFCLVRILGLVETDRGGVPDINLRSHNRPSLPVAHPALKKKGSSRS